MNTETKKKRAPGGSVLTPPFIHTPDLARYIPTLSGRGVTRQRAHWMLRHPDDGDNRQRIKAALLSMRAELDNYLKD